MDYESAIRQYVFLGRTSSSGWAPVLCKVCNDHGKKGPRAAFKFDGDSFGYNCFNCNISGSHSSNSKTMPSDDLKKILTSFGVPADFISELELQVLQNRTDGNSVDRKIFAAAKVSGPKVLEMPSYFTKLSDLEENHPLRVLATLHLEEERAMTPDEYPFYVSMRTEDNESKPWANRLIIPIYNNNNQLIFYQGRDLIGNSLKKYRSVDVPRTNIVYGMHEIYQRTNAPLFVTEGFFDAYHVKGCAILGRQLTQPIIDMLQSSTREKVIIPDRLGDGADLAKQALQLGWKISTPDFGQCKDVTEAVVKYGKLYVFKNIMDNIYSGTAAETMLGLYCK